MVGFNFFVLIKNNFSEESKRQVASETSIAEAIESVVNAGNNHDENSNSSTSSHSGKSLNLKLFVGG